MPEFLDLVPVQPALNRLMDFLPVTVREEEISTQDALGRIVASAILSPHALPAFNRSSVDGYAVRAADTFGASDSMPAYLKLIAEIRMGEQPACAISPGQCCLIHTGGMLPTGADAVLMLEHTQLSGPAEVEVFHSIAFEENVIKEGEDVSSAEIVVEKGTRLRPPEIGGLMSLGLTRITVTARPRVAILSSGDEITCPESELQPGKVRDSNSYSLSALVEEAGGIAVRYGVVPDEVEQLYQLAARALVECDLVIITAGSSASARDFTSQVINRLGEPGVLVHGVNIKPGKPTILGISQGKPVIGLPGNPVSALIVARVFLVPILNKLTGLRDDYIPACVQAQLSLNIASQAGREDWIPVHLAESESGFTAEPLFGKSNLIFTLVRANGLVRIPPDTTGLSSGELVQVFLY